MLTTKNIAAQVGDRTRLKVPLPTSSASLLDTTRLSLDTTSQPLLVTVFYVLCADDKYVCKQVL